MTLNNLWSSSNAGYLGNAEFSFIAIAPKKKLWRIEQKKKRKECLQTALVTAIKKDPTTSIWKHANVLKVYEKTLRIAIKQDLSPDLNPLDYAIWGVLENKTNATSHPNIGSSIEEEWNKMSK